MEPNLSRERFVELAASYPVVPIAIEVLADRETPVSVFEQLVGADDGSSWSRSRVGSGGRAGRSSVEIPSSPSVLATAAPRSTSTTSTCPTPQIP